MQYWSKPLVILLVTVFSFALNPLYGLGNNESYFPDRAFFKVTADYKFDPESTELNRTGIEHIDSFFDKIGVEKIERTFPHCDPPIKGGADLTRIYTFYFPETLPVKTICDELSTFSGIEYAQPWYIDREFLDHNDPGRNAQYGLTLCQANDAHDISTGDPSAVIGIIDSGVDLDHEDLEDNIWVNPGEDLNGDRVIQQNERNGRDDDQNGKIDDFYGWDFYSRDNDPNDTHGHGTHCAGIASAVTNNRTGIASVGYSCSIMAIRAGTGGIISFGYQGIEYAARSHAKVISLSWGSDEHHDYGQDVIDYAYDHDVLIIAAAGNDYSSDVTYPAGYNHVISVAATDRDDRKAGYSNYGEWIDISAPGHEIISTFPGNRYTTWNGTSMACPFAASVAILIRATYDWMSVDQATQALLDGADDIDDRNNRYRGQLGAGRINAYESLLVGMRPILTVEDWEVIEDDNDNGRFDPDEHVSFTVTISNHPEAEGTESLEVTIISDDEMVDVLSGAIEFPNLEPGDEFTNEDDPFIIEISPDAIPQTVFLRVLVSAEPGELEMEKTLEVLIGYPDILIVDDDGGDDIESYYYEAIEEMGFGWARWNVDEFYAPYAYTMMDYEMVIWITGNADPPLGELDRVQMELALLEGVNILLIGNRIGDYESNHEFLRNSFGVEHEANSVDAFTVEALPGNPPLSDDVSLDLNADDGAGNGDVSPSSMNPVYTGRSLLVYYDEFSRDTIGVAAIYQIDEFSGSKTVHFGFAFEGTHGVRTTRYEVLNQIYNWFTGNVEDVPNFNGDLQVNQFSLAPAYPNPFNGSVSIGYTLPVDSWIRLVILDLNGRELDVLGSGFTRAGRYNTIWDAVSFPSGIYFVRLILREHAPFEQKLLLIK
ncbi:S8 family serine peptidase [bacterium]|nr:S8 family serine peptidase [bacterium]